VEFFSEHWPQIVEAARAAGRPPGAVTGAAYVTLALDPSAAAAEQRLDGFLESYYAAPARAIRARQACYAGPIEGCAEWLQRWIDAGTSHILLRFAGGDQLAQVAEAASGYCPGSNGAEAARESVPPPGAGTHSGRPQAATSPGHHRGRGEEGGAAQRAAQVTGLVRALDREDHAKNDLRPPGDTPQDPDDRQKPAGDADRPHHDQHPLSCRVHEPSARLAIDYARCGEPAIREF
jgi:hypothetical protein